MNVYVWEKSTIQDEKFHRNAIFAISLKPNSLNLNSA